MRDEDLIAICDRTISKTKPEANFNSGVSMMLLASLKVLSTDFFYTLFVH